MGLLKCIYWLITLNSSNKFNLNKEHNVWASPNQYQCSTIRYYDQYAFRNLEVATRIIQQFPVQIQQWKHQSNKFNLFRVNNKDSRTTSVTSIWVSSLLTLKRLDTLL